MCGFYDNLGCAAKYVSIFKFNFQSVLSSVRLRKVFSLHQIGNIVGSINVGLIFLPSENLFSITLFRFVVVQSYTTLIHLMMFLNYITPAPGMISSRKEFVLHIVHVERNQVIKTVLPVAEKIQNVYMSDNVYSYNSSLKCNLYHTLNIKPLFAGNCNDHYYFR